MTAALLCAVIPPFVTALFAVVACSAARRHGLDAGFTRRGALAALLLSAFVQAACMRTAGVLAGTALTLTLSACTVAAVTDVSTGYVFDRVTFPALAATLACSAFEGSLAHALLGIAVAAGALVALYALTMGRGLGLGDVKLGACIGAGLGTLDAALALGTAFVIGGIYGTYLLATRRAFRGDALRFAPYLAAGVAIISVVRYWR
ncbi:MAG: prepilin peptidase [Vulcanimicrobiaceae bacterium]